MDLSTNELLLAIADINQKIQQNLNNDPSILRDIKHRFLVIIRSRMIQAYQSKIGQQIQ